MAKLLVCCLFWILATPVVAYDGIDLLVISMEQSQAADVDPHLVQAIIEVESGWRHAAVNRGNYGLMQIHKRVHAPRLSLRQLIEPKTNIGLGIKVLVKCQQRYGTVKRALSCYNGSLGDRNFTYAKKVLSRYRKITPGN